MAAVGRTILVSGRLAAVPGQGGAVWAVMQYVLGLRRLGHDVWLVEPVEGATLQPGGTSLARSASATYFRAAMSEFGMGGRAALLLAGTTETVGVPYAALREAARSADALLNISGLLQDPELTGPVPVRVYVDLDPAFTQLWQAVQSIDMHLEGHTHFVTIGTAIGAPDNVVPTCGRPWIPTLQPVVLEAWPVAASVRRDALTTVANWRGYGSIDYRGMRFGQKAHSLRPFFRLPRMTPEPFALALGIHPGEAEDLAALRENGWVILDPLTVADSPSRYRRFVQESKAEFGIAKSGYVLSRCGWFSDRSVCYLASGRPVIAQDTGFSDVLPTGAGLFAFSSCAEVLAAIDAVNKDYGAHCRAARAIAEEHFDSDRVLLRLLERIGIPA